MTQHLAAKYRVLAILLLFGAVLANVFGRAHAEPAFTSGRITVEVRGPKAPTGPDVILIPGLASSRAVWARTADRLDDTHRVHLVQVNGFGGQPAGLNAQGPVFGPLTDELARYIAERRLKRPVVIGHSMGGELALALAAKQPDAVARVMAVDALPFFSLLMGPEATPDSVRPRAAAMRDAMLAMTADQYAAGAPASITGLVKDPAARQRGARDSAASDKGVVGRAVFDVMTTDLRPALASARAPITILYAYDPAMGPSAMVDGLWKSAYAGVPGAKVVRVDGSLHFIMDDQPERFAREVDAFLAGSDAR